MAQIVGFYNKKISDPTVVDTEQQHNLGTRGVDENGNVYVYLKGITSVAAGTWVTYNNTTGATALLTGSAVGPVAVAVAAVSANTKFGWFQVAGYAAVSKSDTVAGAGVPLYIDGTDGRVDDAVVTGDLVVGATSTAADTTNVLPVLLSYPSVTHTLG